MPNIARWLRVLASCDGGGTRSFGYSRRTLTAIRSIRLNTAIALCVSLTFVALALWHFAMALQPSRGAAGTVPSVAGKPLFVPSARATVGVGFGLLLIALIVAATGNLVHAPVPPRVLTWLSYAIALALLARGVGEFRYVGMFKRVRGSRFAKLDTFVYSPLCLLLAVGVAIVAQHNRV